MKLLFEQLGQGHSHFLSVFVLLKEVIDSLDTEDPDSIEEDLLSILKVCFILMIIFIVHVNVSV